MLLDESCLHELVAVARDDLQQTIGVNDNGIHRLLRVWCAEVGAAELLHTLVVELAALP